MVSRDQRSKGERVRGVAFRAVVTGILAILAVAAFVADWINAGIALLVVLGGQAIVGYALASTDHSEGAFPSIRVKTRRRR
jgi:hypothetical protein